MASQEQYAELLARINFELENYGKITEQTQNDLIDARVGVKDFERMVAGPALQAVSSLGTAIGRTAGNIYRADKGLQTFDEAADSVSDAATQASRALFALGGPIGILLGAIAFVVGQSVKAAKLEFEFVQKQFDAFNSLSKQGLVASDGLTGLFNNMQDLRVNVLNSDTFVQLLADNSQELALFGGTAQLGRQRLAAVNKELQDFQQAMGQLGLTEDERREALLGFIKIEQQNFRLQGRTAQDLAAGAKAYILEQTALTKLTGVDRKTREKMRQDELTEESYQASLQDLRNRGLGEQADRLYAANTLFADQLPEVAKGLRALISGNVNNADAQKLASLGLADIMGMIEQIKTGTPAETVMKSLQKRIVEFSDRQGVQMALFDQTNKTTLSFETQQRARLLEAGKQIEMVGSVGEETARQAGKDMDETTKKTVSATNAFTGSMIYLQGIMQTAAPKVVSALESLATAAEELAKGARGNLEKLGELSSVLQGRFTDLAALLDRSRPETPTVPGEAGEAYGPDELIRTPSINQATAAELQRMDPVVVQRRRELEAAGRTPQQAAAQAAQDARTRQESLRNLTQRPAQQTVIPLPGGAMRTAPAEPASTSGPIDISVAPTTNRQTTQLSMAGLLPVKAQNQAGGANQSQKMLALASAVQKNIPGIRVVNFNAARPDKRELRGGSDVMVAGFSVTPAPDNKQADLVTEMLRKLGANKAEYHGNGQVTYEVKAATGGVFAAKPGGTKTLLAEAGQDEAVIPMKNGAVQVSVKDLALMSAMPKLDNMAMAKDITESVKIGIDQDLRAVVMDIVKQVQAPVNNFELSSRVLEQLDQLIIMQRQANDIDTKMLAAASN